MPPRRPPARAAGLFAGMLLLVAAAWADDTQYRSELYLKLLDTKRVDLTVWGQLGISDSTPNPSRYMGGPKLSYDAWEHLAFGLNYSYFQKESLNAQTHEFEPFREHRLEVEVNPHWTFTNGVQLNLRNRWEHRWFFEEGAENDRSRHRVELVFPVKRARPLTDLFTQAEFFWDYDRNLNSEWRFVPVGLTFQLARQVKLKSFYMLQPIQGVHDWSCSHVFYTQLYLSL